MIDEKEKCPSCGKLYIEHSSIIGTCAEFIEAKARLAGYMRLKPLANQLQGRLDEAVKLLREINKDDRDERIDAFLAGVGE